MVFIWPMSLDKMAKERERAQPGQWTPEEGQQGRKRIGKAKGGPRGTNKKWLQDSDEESGLGTRKNL